MAEQNSRLPSCPICWEQKHQCLRDPETLQCRQCRTYTRRQTVASSSLDPLANQSSKSEANSGNWFNANLRQALSPDRVIFSDFRYSDNCNLSIQVTRSSTASTQLCRITLHIDGPFSTKNEALIAQLDTQVQQVLAPSLRGKDEHSLAVNNAVLTGAYMHLLCSAIYTEKPEKENIVESRLSTQISQSGLSTHFRYLVCCRLQELLRDYLDTIRTGEVPSRELSRESLSTFASVALLNSDVAYFRNSLRKGELSTHNHQRQLALEPILITWLSHLGSELTAYLRLGCGRFPRWQEAIEGSTRSARRGRELLFLTITLNIDNPDVRGDSPPTTINANKISSDLSSAHQSSEDQQPKEDREAYQASASDDTSEKSENIFSDDGKSDDSQSSIGAIRLGLTSEIYFLLRNDEVLRPLYPLALQRMSQRKFQKLMKELLKEYSEGLVSECQNELERKTALFIRTRLRQLIVKLTEEMDPTRPTLSLVLQKPEPENYRGENIESYLQGLSNEGDVDWAVPPATEMDPSNMSDVESDDIDAPETEPETFALTNRLKKFMVASTAWFNLRESFKTIVMSRIAEKAEHKSHLHRDRQEIDVLDMNDMKIEAEQGDDTEKAVQASRNPQQDNLPVHNDLEETDGVDIDDVEIESEQGEDSDKADQESKTSQQDSAHWVFSWPRELVRAFLGVFQGKSLPVGTYRIEWTCRCGHSGSDEYLEVASGGVVNLAKELRESSVITRATVRDRTQTPLKAFVTFVKNAAIGVGKRFRLKSKTESLPTTQSIQMATTTSSAEHSTLALSPKYLLFCTMGAHKRKVATLQHIDICNIISDQELFTTLRQFYPPKRSKLKDYTRKLQAIHFVQFEIRPKYNLDNLRHPKTPPLKKRKVEYEWEAVQTKPPVGSEWMLHIFDCPADAGDADDCVKRFPKKLKDRLAYCRGGENMGWGIYFQEAMDRDRSISVLCIALIGLLGSLAFGTVWTVEKNDIQGAWGVSSWILAAVALLVFVVQACLA